MGFKIFTFYNLNLYGCIVTCNPITYHSVSLFDITPDTPGNSQYTKAVSEPRHEIITRAIIFSCLS
jgi:hypothetical protein